MMQKVRIDRVLSKSGFGSRNDARKLIKEGRVYANGKRVTSFSERVDPSFVEIDHKKVDYREFIYVIMNKPEGVVSATEDKKYKTVIDLLDERTKSYEPFPVGRLDIDTVGLLLITNDGELCHNLLSPKKHIDKTYFVRTLNEVSDKDIDILENGVDLGDFVTMPAKLERAEDGVLITIKEGKFHQVKRMFESVNNKVTYLKRIKMGKILLPDDLKEGEYRFIEKKEIEQ